MLRLLRRGRRSGRGPTSPAVLSPGFSSRYGPWGLVAGASLGLGAAYSRALAARGLNLVLVARQPAVLTELAADLRSRFGVDTRCCCGDLGDPSFVASLIEACADLEVGLLVYNAAFAPVGEFATVPAEDVERVVQVNVRAPVALARALLPAMIERGRGGMLLMSSLAGNQGSPYLAAYAASKAFTRELAESLWYEAKLRGVDVLACCAGAIRTPGYAVASKKDAPGTLDPEEVAESALTALARGPVFIPGLSNRLATLMMTRLFPRRVAIAIMAKSTAGLGRGPGGGPPSGPSAGPGATAGSAAAGSAAAGCAASAGFAPGVRPGAGIRPGSD